VGEQANAMIEKFWTARGDVSTDARERPDAEHDLIWTSTDGLRSIALKRPEARKKRHVRKYAEGELGEDKSFYFRGPEGALNLRAQNLAIFLQLADGVDDKTWMYHLRSGEYSRWFDQAIKDEGMASEARRIEQDNTLSPQETRSQIKKLVESKYTAPAKSA
jgi:hypothetical protein